MHLHTACLEVAMSLLGITKIARPNRTIYVLSRLTYVRISEHKWSGRHLGPPRQFMPGRAHRRWKGWGYGVAAPPNLRVLHKFYNRNIVSQLTPPDLVTFLHQ